MQVRAGKALRDPVAARPVLKREVERLDRHSGGARKFARAALEGQAVADRKDALGGERHLVVLRQQQAGRRERIAAQAAQRDEQVIARPAVQPGQHEALVDPREALLRRPACVAGECQFLAAGALRKAHVGLKRRGALAAGLGAAARSW